MDLTEYGRRTISAELGLATSGPVEVLVAHDERAVFGAGLADGRRIVVKVDVESERVAREVAAVRAASRVGVPVPEVVAVAAGSAASVAVFGWVAGEPLTSASPDPCWHAVGEQLRTLHDRIPIDGWPPFLPAARDGWWAAFRRWADEECELTVARGRLPAEIADTLLLRMAVAFDRAPEPELRVLHGDCTPYHWLHDSCTVTAAIDFGDAGLGDPAWDLVVLTHWDSDRLPAVLDGYRACAALRTHLAQTFDGYRIMRHLAATSWLAEKGIDPAPTVAELLRVAGADYT